MANNRYIKTHSNYVIKDLHQATNAGNIFERDFMTISSLNSYAPGSTPSYELNGFKMIVNNKVNLKKKYNFGSWVKNKSCDDVSYYWSLNCIDDDTQSTNSLQIKPNRQNLLNFTCFGSMTKLVEATISEIVNDFPAEIYFTEKNVFINGETYYKIDNPFNIEFDRFVLDEKEDINPLRNFSQNVEEYVITLENGLSSSSFSWDVRIRGIKEMCNDDNTFLSEIYLGLPFGDDSGVLRLYCFSYRETNDEKPKKTLFYKNKNFKNAYIRPKNKHVNSFFNNLSEFGKTLLNKKTGYTVMLETPEERDYGNVFTLEAYTWPKRLYGDWNLDIVSQSYFDYVEGLVKIGEFYDKYFTDNIWRSMTHEAIVNFDWTHVHIDGDGTITESHDPNSGAVKAFIHVAGRQFDELKMYIDGIKTSNAITYNENGNKPDIFLSESIENYGWDVKVPISLNKYPSYRLYPNHVEGVHPQEANYEFFRRLALNSSAIMRAKGTKRAIEMVMALFGYYSTNFIENSYHEVKRNGVLKTVHWDNLTIEEQNAIKLYSYDLTEYVYVANSQSNLWTDPDAENGETSEDYTETMIEEVKNINMEKLSYDGDINDEYQGLPLKEVSVLVKDVALPYWDADGQQRIKYTTREKSYLIPWYDRNKTYDNDLYFESKGGWGLKQTTISRFNDYEEVVIDSNQELKIYDETIKYIRFVDNIQQLTRIFSGIPKRNTIYYVYDISDMDLYDWGEVSILKQKYDENGEPMYKENGEPIYQQLIEQQKTMSHYFILKEEGYDYVLGVLRDEETNNPLLEDETIEYNENGAIMPHDSEKVDENGVPLKKYGWKNISEEELKTGISIDAKQVYYLEGIIEENLGNNPHCGFGNYDDGEEYINGFKDIFKGAIDNSEFEYRSDDEMPENIGFSFDKMIDNVKCWYFTDTFNTETKLKEIDLEETNYGKEIDGEIVVPDDNTASMVGYGENFFRMRYTTQSGSEELFTSTQYRNMVPYNVEDENNFSDEAAANSIVNNKQLFIEFMPDMTSPESTFDFIENVVMFYVKQVIPSTTLLKYYVHLRDSEVNCYQRTYLQSAIIN